MVASKTDLHLTSGNSLWFHVPNSGIYTVPMNTVIDHYRTFVFMGLFQLIRQKCDVSDVIYIFTDTALVAETAKAQPCFSFICVAFKGTQFYFYFCGMYFYIQLQIINVYNIELSRQNIAV